MHSTSLRARRLGVAVLGSAGLLGALLAGVPAPASAAVTPITVTAPAGGLVKITGSSGNDQIVLSRTGTATAPRVDVDATTPLAIQVGCSPVAGDATRASCTAPLASTSTLKSVLVFAGTGDDTISHAGSLPIPLVVSGSGGKDVVNGGPGVDSLSGGPDDDILRGGGGTDELKGTSGNDVLEGGPGTDDNLYGGTGDDVLRGGDGDSDDLDGGPGADTFDGGAGRNDIVLYIGRVAAVTANLATTDATNGEVGEKDRYLSGVENVFGGDGNDVLFGDAGDNNLLGADGNDVISGGAGKDATIGGEGDDTISGNFFDIGFPSWGPNADGRIDFIGGEAGNDTCVRSAADGDSVTDCETVFIDD